jgi:hypothetical protein
MASPVADFRSARHVNETIPDGGQVIGLFNDHESLGGTGFDTCSFAHEMHVLTLLAMFITHRCIVKGRWTAGVPDADTIENLRARLTEQTCHNVAEYPEDGFWPWPHFKCNVCGGSYISDNYVYYCPSCGRRIVE